jgi:hypothetical protein
LHYALASFLFDASVPSARYLARQLILDDDPRTVSIMADNNPHIFTLAMNNPNPTIKWICHLEGKE